MTNPLPRLSAYPASRTATPPPADGTLPPFPAGQGPAAAARLRARHSAIDSLILSLEGALEHLDRSFAAGLEVQDQRAATQERLRRIAGGR